MEATQDRTVQRQLTITEFLEARIAEDEATAREIADCESHDPAGQGYEGTIMETVTRSRHGAITVDPARLLAECAAKRAIFAMGAWAVLSGHTAGDNCGLSDPDRHNAAMVGLEVLAVIAAVYSSHPDYRQEWAPRG